MLPMIKFQVTTPYSAGIKKGNKSLLFPGCCPRVGAAGGDELMHDDV